MNLATTTKKDNVNDNIKTIYVKNKQKKSEISWNKLMIILFCNLP